MALCINRSWYTSKDPATAKKINLRKSYSCNVLLGFLVQQLKNKKNRNQLSLSEERMTESIFVAIRKDISIIILFLFPKSRAIYSFKSAITHHML